MSKNIPEIRINGFDKDWKQCKLGKLCSITTGKLDANAMVEDGDYDFYTSGIEKYRIDIAAFEGPAITIAGNGASVGYMHLADGKFNAYQRTYVLRDFLADRQFLSSVIGQELPLKIQEEIRGSGIPYIIMDMLTELNIPLPNKEEQYKVGTFFSDLDNLITLHQQEYDKLVNNKKAMLEKMFPKEGCDVPEIRFKGFDEPWERCTFKECFGLLTNNTLSRAELNDEYGTICNIHYGDILIKFKETINAENDKLPFITTDINVAKTALLQNGDIIIADTAEDSTVGKCTEITGILNKNVVSGLHTIPCRPCKEFSKGYLGFFMNSPAYHNQLFPLMQGTKVTSVSKAALQNTMIYYPSDINEQKLIGDFFININSLIVHHQQELEKLKNIKAALLEKMFV